MNWATACPDWARRIVAGESLIPLAPLFPDEADAGLRVFRSLRIADVAGKPRAGDVSRPWLLDFVAQVFGAYDPEAERQLCALVKEKFGSDFVFVTDYDASIRPFYHMRPEANQGLTHSYDLLYNGTEISTGAQREHRVDVLEKQAQEKGLSAEDLEHYLDFFRHGVPPHGGFGMGLARVLMLMLGQSSIRETTYLFRGPNRLLP